MLYFDLLKQNYRNRSIFQQLKKKYQQDQFPSFLFPNKQQNHMDEPEQVQLTKSSKILYNLLEIRIFDISQALQVAGHKFSINQIKQTLQKQYNIFGQVEKIYDQLKLNYLYDMMKQISQNYISIASILLDKKFVNADGVKIDQSQTYQTNSNKNNRRLSSNKRRDSKQLLQEMVKQQQNSFRQKFEKLKPSSEIKDQNNRNTPRSSFRRNTVDVSNHYSMLDSKSVAQMQKSINDFVSQKTNSLKKFNLNKLGGITLFNENYYRGIESMQKKYQALQLKKRKHFDQKQLIKQLIFKQISDQADVQKLYQNDQISKFIKQGKIKHQLYNHIEYEKDLQSISAFLKQSQDDALKFLTDSKKVKEQQTNQTQEDIIINYHQLIEILAEKKKNQYQIVEQKIKEIVDSFRSQADILYQNVWKKEERIKELEYKLKRKEGKQFGMQTAGFKNKFNLNNNSQDIQEIQEQHKIVVEMFKKNLDQNQKQLLNLETQIKQREQKLKKKDTQMGGMKEENQKLKKQLKQQKQLRKTILKDQQQQFNINGTQRNSVDQPIDIKLDKLDLQSNIDNQLIQSTNFIKPNKKRKQKYSIFGGHSNSLLAGQPSNLIKNRQDSILSSAFSQDRNKKFTSSILNTKHNFYKTQNLNGRLNLTQADGALDNQKTDEEISSENRIYNSRMNKQLLSQNQLDAARDTGNQQKHKLNQQIKSKNNATIKNQTSNKSSATQKQKLQSQSPRSSEYPSSTLFNTQSFLLQKNSQTMYHLIFDSSIIDSINKGKISENDNEEQHPNKPQIDTNFQINKLKQFISKYDQNVIGRRLKKILSFINRENDMIAEKNLSEQEEGNEEQIGYRGNHESKQIKDRYKAGQLRFKQNNTFQKQKSSNRTDRKHTNYKNQTSDLTKQSSPKGKILKFSSNKSQTSFLNKLHKQLRISGKGFELSREQFINICNIVQIPQQNNQNHSHSPSNSQFSQNQNHQKQSIVKQQKNGGKILPYVSKYNKMKEVSLLTENDQNNRFSNVSSNDQGHNAKKLLIQGQSIVDINHIGYSASQTEKDIFAKNKKNKEEGKCICTCKNHHDHSKNNDSEMKSPSPTKQQQQYTIKVKAFVQKPPNSQQSSPINQASESSTVPIQQCDQNKSQQKTSPQQKLKFKRQIKQFYKILKTQGGQIESINQLEEMIQNSQMNLEDIIKITQLLKSQKPEDVSRLFKRECQHHQNENNNHYNQNNKDTVKHPSSSSMIQQCCSHIKKYSSFLQRLSMNQQSVKRMKKDIFALHIFNIDGKASQKDFYKKEKSTTLSGGDANVGSSKLAKQKSSKYLDKSYGVLDSGNSSNYKMMFKENKRENIQAQSFHVNSNKRSEINVKDINTNNAATLQRDRLKKQAVSVYVQSKQKNTSSMKPDPNNTLSTLKKQLSQYLVSNNNTNKHSQSISNSFLPQLNTNNNPKCISNVSSVPINLKY